MFFYYTHTMFFTAHVKTQRKFMWYIVLIRSRPEPAYVYYMFFYYVHTVFVLHTKKLRVLDQKPP